MKRILSLFIVLVLMLSTLASCEFPFFVNNNKTEEVDINKAVDYLENMYGGNKEGTSTPADFELISSIGLGNDNSDSVTVFTITWTASVDSITITYSETDMVYIVNVPDDVAEVIDYKLIATITTEGGQNATVEFNRKLPPSGYGVIENPTVGTAYKFALLHGNENAVVYFDGNNYNSYAWYLAYTTDPLAAVDVYLEAVEGVEGGYRLYFDNGEKTYIRAFPRDGDTTKGTLELTTVTPEEYYTFNDEYDTLIYTSTTGEQFYIGSSGTYKSISLSSISYIDGATSYVAHLYGPGGYKQELPVQELPTIPENYTSEDVVEALYKLESGQQLEGPYYITGIVTSIKYEYDPAYANVSVVIQVGDLADKPVLLYRIKGAGYAENVKVGDTITVLAGITNYNGTYETVSGGQITELVPGTGEVPTPTPTPDPGNAEEILNTLYGLADGESVTGEFTLTGKITALDNYNNPTIVVEGFEDKPVYCYRLVVTQTVGETITVKATTMKNYGGTYEFMNCTLVEEGGDDPVVTPNYSAPVAGQPYNFFIEQTTLGKKLYFAGAMSGSYLATTEDAAAAVVIYFEEVTGGYHIYFMDGETKTYITAAAYIKSNGYAGCHFSLTTETPTLAWTYDTNLGIIEIYDEIEGKSDTFFAGTYGSYDTFSLSGAYYKEQISSGTQFPGRIELAEGGEVIPPVEGGDDTTGDDNGTDTPTGPVEMSIPDALAAAVGTQVIVKGQVIEVNQVWNTQFNNMTVTIADADGNELYVYRMGTQVVAGDFITVTGTVGEYNGAKQIAQGATAEVTGHEDLVVDANCHTLSFADVANRKTFTTSQQIWEANGVKVTNNKAQSTQNVADYSAPARFYASTELIIEYAGMTKIVFHLNSGKPAAGLTDSISGTGFTVTTDGYDVTITFDNAVDMFSVAKLVAQIRVDSIDVYTAE